jgi:hypothetical protein
VLVGERNTDTVVFWNINLRNSCNGVLMCG